MTYVAIGRFDGYWEKGLNIWDIAAGLIIAREAGAIVEGVSRGSNPEKTGELICATEVQFEKFAKVIRSSL